MAELTGEYKVLSLEQLKDCTYSHVFIKCTNPHNNHFDRFVEVRVNGKSKTWKRQPGRVQLPYKYGLYEYGYITESDEVRVPVY